MLRRESERETDVVVCQADARRGGAARALAAGARREPLA